MLNKVKKVNTISYCALIRVNNRGLVHTVALVSAEDEGRTTRETSDSKAEKSVVLCSFELLFNSVSRSSISSPVAGRFSRGHTSFLTHDKACLTAIQTDRQSIKGGSPTALL
jgi:hypothetical protein